MNTIVNSEIIEPQQNGNYTEYDSVTSTQFCSPTYMGFGVCVGATAENGYLVLQLIGKTPIGNYTKSFKITKDISFEWSPISRFKISVAITNFKNSGGYFSFDFKGKVCGKIPFLGWKCASYTHHFSLPDSQSKLEEISDQELAVLIALTK